MTKGVSNKRKMAKPFVKGSIYFVGGNYAAYTYKILTGA